MKHIVYCLKLKKSSKGLDYPPFPGVLGNYIYKNISKKAWSKWLKYQTILVNEHRLSLSDKKVRKNLLKHMKDYFFDDENYNFNIK